MLGVVQNLKLMSDLRWSTGCVLTRPLPSSYIVGEGDHVFRDVTAVTERLRKKLPFDRLDSRLCVHPIPVVIENPHIKES